MAHGSEQTGTTACDSEYERQLRTSARDRQRRRTTGRNCAGLTSDRKCRSRSVSWRWGWLALSSLLLLSLLLSLPFGGAGKGEMVR